MAREWKPGDVVLWEHGGNAGTSEVLMRRDGGWYASDGPLSDGLAGGSLRPLAVIDPEDREQVERLYRTYASIEPNGQMRGSDFMQAALREFANPTPSAPTEDGWYAYDGGRQTMIFRLTRGQWYAITDSGQCDPCEWGYISQALGVWNLVRVLSEGVTP